MTNYIAQPVAFNMGKQTRRPSIVSFAKMKDNTSAQRSTLDDHP
jgi:hypothetical protein